VWVVIAVLVLVFYGWCLAMHDVRSDAAIRGDFVWVED